MQSDSYSASGTEKLNAGPSADSVRVTDSALAAGWGPVDRPGQSRPVRFLTALYRQTLVDPIEQGRLRDVLWPYGLRAIVLTGYIVFTTAGLIVIFSGLIRKHSTLIVFGFGSGLGLPEQTVWPLVLFLSFGVAALMAAAQHAPAHDRDWW